MSVREALDAAGVGHAIALGEASLAERAMREFDIATQTRAAHFLAQVLHESGGLQRLEVLTSGAEHEGRADLGNTQPGDGLRYKGRGPLPLIGRAAYRICGAKLGLDLEEHPELAADSAVGWRIAAVLWRDLGLNELADRHEFERITEAINGGREALEARRLYLGLLQRVDCRPVNPAEGFTVAELAWIREYDRLLASHRDPERRVALRRLMTIQRKRIWRVAQPTSNGGDGRGWQHASRQKRYAALLARTARPPLATPGPPGRARGPSPGRRQPAIRRRPARRAARSRRASQATRTRPAPLQETG